MASTCAVRVLEQCQVSPPPRSVAPASLLLTFFDVIWLDTSPVERFFLYQFPHPTPNFLGSYCPNLKSSLSVALLHFYPLAGKVRLSPKSDEQFELCYIDGDSVPFTVAEIDGNFHDLIGSHPRDFAKLKSLIPRLVDSDAGKPVLGIQVTVFPNQGISIGLAIHHVACDGFNSMQFIKSWASACRSGGSNPLVAPAPSFDRTVIADPYRLYSALVKEVLEIKNEQPIVLSSPSAHHDLVSASVTLGPYHIERLKQRVQAKAEVGEASFHCSTFVVSCAFVWVSLVKTRGYAGDRTANFVFAVDWRQRLQPPIPTAYFGNCIGPCFVEANVGDLVKEGGFVEASEAIGRAIEGLKDGVYKSVEGFLQKFLALVPCQPMSVAGSPKFKVYDTDIGWGRPQKVEVTSIQNTGAISLSESREEQGGVEIGLVLSKRKMEEFVAHFISALELP